MRKETVEQILDDEITNLEGANNLCAFAAADALKTLRANRGRRNIGFARTQILLAHRDIRKTSWYLTSVGSALLEKAALDK
jgi:hypothetical protein